MRISDWSSDVCSSDLLFVVLWLLSRNERIRSKPGVLCGVFLIGYAISRIIVEFVREPDAQLGFLLGGATMGQLLSAPILLVGVYLELGRASCRERVCQYV